MKRTKLIASLMMCVFCLSFLVVGVWATVTSVNFNLNGNLQFYPEGVYVELSGQVYRGNSTTSLEPLTSDTRFTLEPTTNFDNSTGEPSGNFPMESWNIQNLTFTPVDRFIDIRVTIKNHSAFAITATPTAQLNNQDITSSTFTNFTVTDNREESGVISSGETKTYNILIELNEGSTAFTGNALSVSFKFDKVPKIFDYLTWEEDDANNTDVVDGYWTLTMGEYQGKPLVWRMVLKEENNDVSSVVGYTQDTELSGSYYFLLDTYIADVFNCSYENYVYSRYGTRYRLDEYKDIASINEYSISNIREYLTGINVYRGYVENEEGEYIMSEALYTGQTEPENFLDKFNIRNSYVYNMIEGRSLADLYSRMKNDLAGSSVKYNESVESKISSSTVDKLWLLSYYEASKIPTVQGNTAIEGVRRWDANYWLRTPSGYSEDGLIHLNGVYQIYINTSGAFSSSTPYDVAYVSSKCARPAFKISL